MEQYIKEERSGVRAQAPICDRQSTVEIISDFSLPDYQPEIKRLLRVKATTLPPDHYIGAGNAEFSGTVNYTILYAGNDGALYCVNESGEYHFNIPLEMTSDFEWNAGIICDCDVFPETAVGRVVAPRKFSVKCRLRNRVCLWGTRFLEETVIGTDKQSIQRLCGQCDTAQVFVGIGDPIDLVDEVLFESTESDQRVISVEGQVYISEANAGSGRVSCRGEIALKLLVADESGKNPVQTLWRRIPLVGEVPTDGAEVNCDALVTGTCSRLNVTVEDRRILCEVSVILRAIAQRNERIGFTRDIYSTVASCETKYTAAAFAKALKCVCGNISVNTTLTAEEAGIRDGMQIVDLCVIPSVASLETNNGKYQLSGRARCQTILSDGEELSAQEFEIPFRYECDGDHEEVKDWSANAEAISYRARMDGERIAIDAELAISLITRGESNVKLLREAHFGEVISHNSATCTLYYPSCEDTLWSIAKRYHKSVDTLSTLNNLSDAPRADSPESLAGIKYLLV